MRIVLVVIASLYSAGLAVWGYFRFKRLNRLLEDNRKKKEYVSDRREEQKRSGRAKADDPTWMEN